MHLKARLWYRRVMAVSQFAMADSVAALSPCSQTLTKPRRALGCLCAFSQKLQPVQQELQQDTVNKIYVRGQRRMAKDWSQRVYEKEFLGGFGFVLAPVSEWK